ncbi:MAG: hypothetical protein CVV47_02510 [Spirochaetae bacterium HGW-Spirochaetae-3]|nr:MAG: hypothetical protein CVV47_02510 [Spirochaetae bacterium HGW-Spirochaetae-3]
MGSQMNNDVIEFDKRITAALAGKGSPVAAKTLAARLAEGSAVASVRLGAGRDAVLMAAVAARILAEPGLKALVVAPGDRDVAGLKAAFDSIGADLGLSCSTIGRDGAVEDAIVAVGSLDAIASRAAAKTLDTRSYGLLALSDLDGMADFANAAMLRNAFGTASGKRRCVAFSAEPGPAHLAIARDLGGPVVELDLEAEGERARNAPSSTYSVRAEDKPRLLLGLLSSGAAKPVAVFCDLRDTAEATAKMLRSRGISTEYVLGNLPRKRAVLDSVIAGDYDVLVLTDEGASGLPGSWAATLVNWDLPLEGEPYVARLEFLDAARNGAGVYNFACERYSFGIPAIERMLGSRLAPVPADESMMTPAGPVPSVRPPAGRAPDKGSERRRPDDRRDRSDRGGQYDGRNVRAIQADIAAITGGRPVSVASPPDKSSSDSAKPGKKRGKKGRGSATKPGQGRPAEATAGDRGKRGGETSRAPSRGSRGGNPQRLSDPYSVSMEERLRLYRERYGATGEPAKAPKAGSPRPAGGKPSRGKASSPTHPRSAQERKRPEPRPAPADKGPAPSSPKGIFGAIKDLFGKKGE